MEQGAMYPKVCLLPDSQINHKKYKMNKKSSSIFLVMILISSLFTSKGAAMGDMSNYRAQIKEKYKKVDLSDGVSKEEAIIIAQNYMVEQKEAFWRVYKLSRPKVVDVDLNDPIFRKLDSAIYKENWVISFPTTLKFRWKTGLKWNTIYVNKTTGKVQYAGEGPS